MSSIYFLDLIIIYLPGYFDSLQGSQLRARGG